MAETIKPVKIKKDKKRSKPFRGLNIGPPKKKEKSPLRGPS